MSIRLYHGSDIAIPHPLVGHNTGHTDLGNGFYLTDDHDAALGRARSRARRTGQGTGIVSVYDLDETCVPWVLAETEEREATWASRPHVPITGPFGLCFSEDPAGLASWMGYMGTCRRGNTLVNGLGNPAIVRAWIATEEFEMVHAGVVNPSEMAKLMEPADLVVQYCLLDQDILDHGLTFVAAEQAD